MAIGRREASIHVRAQEAGEVDVNREGWPLGEAGRRVRDPYGEASAQRALIHPGGDGHAGPEVDAGARRRDGEDGPRVERDVVAVGVAKRDVAVGIELDGHG
jgi:hypothetical protein